MMSFRAFAAGALLPLIGVAAQAQSVRQHDFVTDRIVVKFRGSATPFNAPIFGPVTGLPEVDRLSTKWGATKALSISPEGFGDHRAAESLGLDRVYVYHVPGGSNVRRMANEFRAADGVEDAYVDGKVHALLTPNDPQIGNCWGLNNTGQFGGTPDADIDAFEAWDIHPGGNQVILAVLDTGIDASHPEVAGKILPGRNTLNNNNNVADGHGHGTHCSGTAAAWGNNGIGFAGVSWGAQILPVKVLDNGGGGTWTSVAQGIIWAADNGAWIISMSLGGSSGSSEAEAAVNYAHGKGVLVVAAAGNTGSRFVLYPAAYANCYAVSATTHTDALASFSSYGPQIDVAAPGESVYSSLPGNRYDYWSGTSMACPHVTGLAALTWSLDPGLSRDELWRIVYSTADDKGATGWDERFGWGRINADRAMRAVAAPLVYASSISYENATETGGTLASLRFSDNDRLRFRLAPSLAPTAPWMAVILNGTSPSMSPNRLDMIAEEHASENVTRRVEFFNWTTNAFEVVHSKITTTSSDSITNAVVTSNPSRFVNQANGAMRARISYIDPTPVASPLEARVDHARWAVR